MLTNNIIIEIDPFELQATHPFVFWFQVGPAWDCYPPTYSISVKHESRSSGLKRWSSYIVETKQLNSSVTRKYKHFLWLYDKLAEVFPCISLPPLPVKQYSGNLGSHRT